MIRSLLCMIAVVVGLTSATAETHTQGIGIVEGLRAFQEVQDLLLAPTARDRNAAPHPTPEYSVSILADAGVWYLNDGTPLHENRLVLPVDTVIEITVTSNDLIYEMTFLTLDLKFVGIPGRLETVNFTFNQTGIYEGDCALCGRAGAPLLLDVRADVSADP